MTLSIIDLDPMGSTESRARKLLSLMLDAVVASADPARVLADQLPQPPVGRCVVIGAGKAAASMAAAVEAAWPEVPLSGVVVVPYGYGLGGYSLVCHHIRVREAAHPVPDENSVSAAQEMLQAVQGLASTDMVLALISGGGSSTLCLPAPGLTLDDKRMTNRLLLASGLDIKTMNAVRRRISAIKGGKLAAAAAPARVVTLAISDIPGDDLAAIASGPTVAPGPDRDLRHVAEKLGPTLPRRVVELMSMPGESDFSAIACEAFLVATPAAALRAAAQLASAYGIEPVILGDDIEGESRLVAQEMARRITDVEKPTVLISGGETTVTIGNGVAGRGGRNTEFVLALAHALNGRSNVWVLAADTDGEDGANLGAAGAMAGPETIRRARAAGLDPAAYLAGHDSGSFFEALGDLVFTGPTRTNVNDFRAILILP